MHVIYGLIVEQLHTLQLVVYKFINLHCTFVCDTKHSNGLARLRKAIYIHRGN